MAQKFDYAAVLLETVDNKLLFHHRDNKPNIANPNKIGFFGGGIDRNETPISAAIREIKEELNLDLKLKELIPFCDYKKSEEIHGINQLCKVFLVKNVDITKLRLNLNEGQGIVSISREDNISDYNLTIMVKELIYKYWNI